MLDKAQPSVSDLLRSRRPGYSPPAGFYTRQDVLEADMEVIFHRHWILVGLECDVPESGDVHVIDIGRSSIAIVRDDEGEVRGFFNNCRHRGAKILPPGNSVVGKLVCPYHQWTYELTGDLVRAPHMGKDFDASCHGLKPVHLRSVGGLLYACLSDNPPADIEDLVATAEPRLAPYDLRNAKVAHQTDIVEKGNWKLVIENNRECYHCGSNHPELCNTFIDLDFGYDLGALNPEDRATADQHEALYAAKVAEWEAQGHPSAPVDHLSPEHVTNFRTQRLILSGGGESQTMNGLAACKKLLGSMTRKDLGDTHLWGHNSWSHFMGDHAVVFTIFPISPDETLLRTRWLVHKDAVEGVDYDVKTLTEVWTATNQQDSDLVAIAHAGARGHGYQPGPYSRFTENQLDNFTGWYVARMQAHGF